MNYFRAGKFGEIVEVTRLLTLRDHFGSFRGLEWKSAAKTEISQINFHEKFFCGDLLQAYLEYESERTNLVKMVSELMLLSSGTDKSISSKMSENRLTHQYINHYCDPKAHLHRNTIDSWTLSSPHCFVQVFPRAIAAAVVQ